MLVSPVLGQKHLKHVGFKVHQMSQASLACISQSASATNVDVPTCHSPVFISLPALNCVCKSIGTNWKDLARNLSVHEGDIEETEVEYPRKVQERAYEVFKEYAYDLFSYLDSV